MVVLANDLMGDGGGGRLMLLLPKGHRVVRRHTADLVAVVLVLEEEKASLGQAEAAAGGRGPIDVL